jgi:hypothetical protein
MNGVSGGAAGQHIALDPRAERLFGDLKIIRRLKVHPVLRGSSEITGQPHPDAMLSPPLSLQRFPPAPRFQRIETKRSSTPHIVCDA